MQDILKKFYYIVVIILTIAVTLLVTFVVISGDEISPPQPSRNCTTINTTYTLPDCDPSIDEGFDFGGDSKNGSVYGICYRCNCSKIVWTCV